MTQDLPDSVMSIRCSEDRVWRLVGVSTISSAITPRQTRVYQGRSGLTEALGLCMIDDLRINESGKGSLASHSV